MKVIIILGNVKLFTTSWEKQREPGRRYSMLNTDQCYHTTKCVHCVRAWFVMMRLFLAWYLIANVHEGETEKAKKKKKWKLTNFFCLLRLFSFLFFFSYLLLKSRELRTSRRATAATWTARKAFTVPQQCKNYLVWSSRDFFFAEGRRPAVWSRART